uniref:Secreted protein n=1 Tax=Angiostrongylus cantonensis TaxID=6313 RepID=A0A0K0D0P1_ANGCA
LETRRKNIIERRVIPFTFTVYSRSSGVSSKALPIMNSFVNYVLERIAAEVCRFVATKTIFTSYRQSFFAKSSTPSDRSSGESSPVRGQMPSPNIPVVVRT